MQMIHWFSDPAELMQAIESLSELDKAITSFLQPKREIGGFCSSCRKAVTFHVPAGQEATGEWRNFLEGMICDCGTNGRTRLAVSAFRYIRDTFKPNRKLIFERVTPLFSLLSREDPSLEGAEFLGQDKVAGTLYDHGDLNVRHEDMTALSCADSCYDLLLHFDVIEHVPDHRAAFRECYRVLRPGGQMLFTIPFYTNLKSHIVRAIQTSVGIQHILPAAFHGNPVGDGALVFFHPGWELLEDLSEAGFKTEIGLQHNLATGIVSNGCPWPDGHMWPVVFLATRPH